MSDKRYRFILFDADGTLLDYEKSEEAALQASLEEEGIPYRKEDHLEVYRIINQELWELFEQGGIRADDLRIERFRRFLQELNLETDPVPIARRYLGHLAQEAHLYDGAEKVLKSLKPRYMLGIVTNGLKEVQRNRFSRTVLPAYMDCIIVSDEVGVQKPDPAIFRLALEAAGHQEPGTTLVVGDSLTSDIQGGWNAGMDTCWFNPGGKGNITNLRPTYEIRDLIELLQIL